MSVLQEISEYIADVLDENPDKQEIAVFLPRTKAVALLDELPPEYKETPEMKCRREFDRATEVLCDVTKTDARNIISKRNYPYLFYRAIIASYLRSRKITLSMIGRILGRDHSSISYYFKILEENRDNPTMNNIYAIRDAFNEKIKSYSPNK